MKKIVDQIRLSSVRRKKIFFKRIKIKWYLVGSKHHYYEIKIDQKSILKVKCKGVIVTKRLLNDIEEDRILGYLNDLNLKLPLPDSSSRFQVALYESVNARCKSNRHCLVIFDQEKAL